MNCVISYFLQIIENDALYHCYKFLVKEGLITNKRCCLEKDGLCFPPQKEYDEDELMNNLNQYILEKSTFNIKYKIKGYEEENIDYPLLENVKEEYEEEATNEDFYNFEDINAVDLADYFLKMYQDNFIRVIEDTDKYKNNIYHFSLEEGNIWTNHRTKDEIKNMIPSVFLKSLLEQVELKYKNDGSLKDKTQKYLTNKLKTTSSLNNIIEMIESKIKTEKRIIFNY